MFRCSCAKMYQSSLKSYNGYCPLYYGVLGLHFFVFFPKMFKFLPKNRRFFTHFLYYFRPTLQSARGINEKNTIIFIFIVGISKKSISLSRKQRGN